MPEAAMPRAVVVLVGTAAFVIVVAGVRSIPGIVGPTLLALVLVITMHPLRERLARRLPEWAASVVTLLAVYALLAALALAIIVSVGKLGSLIPQYAPQIRSNTADFGDWLTARGVGQQQADAAVAAVDPDKLVSLATDVLSSMVSILSSLFFLAILLLFMVLDTTSTRRVIEGASAEKPEFVAALVTFTHGARSYIGVSAVFGLIVAVIDSTALWLMGVPAAFVWGVLSFVTNFIPNIGFVIGLIPPAIIGLLEGGPTMMLGVIVVYCAINFVIQSVIQPRVVGDVVGLSATLTMLSLVFWSWALGALGALLAVPMTLLIRALLVQADPSARWLLPVLSGKPAASPVPNHPD